MRKYHYLLLLALISSWAYSQTHEVHLELGQAFGGGSSVDINNDGHLDIYIAGMKDNPPPTPESERWNRMFFYNPSTHEYDSTGTNLQVINRANLDWADIDGDGLLDLLGTEHSFTDYHGGVYKNNGDGQFTQLDWPMPPGAEAAAWADFNNDGLMDYVCISNDSLRSCVMINKGDDTFDTTNVDVFDGMFFGLGYVEVLDYNNDGYMDFFMMANVDNATYDQNDGARVLSDVFINYDEEPGNFYRAYLGKTENNPGGCIYMKSYGGVDFADYNGDGWIDMALHGEGGEGTGEPPSDNEWACISHVYLNAKDGTFTDRAQSAFQEDLRPLSSTGAGTGVIDWNIDGFYDLIITGWNPPTVNTQDAYLYYGDGDGNFTEVGRVPGASETTLLFNDWNGDGFPDYLVSGHSWDNMWYGTDETGRTAAVYYNTNTTTVNQPPSAPSNLDVQIDGSLITLGWDAATDDLTPAASLSYEFFLKDGDGNYVLSPASFVGGDLDGVRKVLKLGNACLNTFAILKDIPYGSYTWGVQAIDASYAGSVFTTGEFDYWAISVEEVKAPDLADVFGSGDMLVVRGKAYEHADVEVYNLLGQEILTKRIGDYFTTPLPQGIYIVKVSARGSVQSGKIFIR